jgi:hypothetical protein
MRAAPSPVRRSAVALAWIVCFGLAIGITVNVVHRGLLGADAHAYWLTGHESRLYTHPPQSRDAFLYSPVFAQAIWLLTQLPWVWFRGIWMAGELFGFIWLLAPLGRTWAPPLIALTAIEAGQGNIWAFLGVAAVLGFRWPESWSLAMLTKISLTFGPLWFLVRGEWQSVLRALWPAALLAAVSVAASPHQWADWIHFLRHSGSNGGGLLIARVAIGVVLAGVAARTGRAWLLILAMLVAAPVLHGVGFLSLLAAMPRMQPAFTAARDHRLTTAKIVAEP